MELIVEPVNWVCLAIRSVSIIYPLLCPCSQMVHCTMWDQKKRKRERWWSSLKEKGRFSSTATSMTLAIIWARRRLCTGYRASTTGLVSSKMWWTGYMAFRCQTIGPVPLVANFHKRCFYLFRLKCVTPVNTQRGVKTGHGLSVQ